MAVNKQIRTVRLDNVKRLLDEKWGGNKRKMERELSLSQSTVGKWISRGNVPDAQARRIEDHLGMERGELDRSDEPPLRVYYVMVSIRGHRVRDFIEYLRFFSIVREVSALFGEMDVFVKVESTEREFQDLVLRKMQRYPSVRYTKTFQGLEGARWQTAQEAMDLSFGGDGGNEDLISRIINLKMKAIFNGLEALDRNLVTLSKGDPFGVHPKEILDNVKSEVRWTSRYSKDRFRNDRELLSCSRKATRDRGASIRKIYLLDDEAQSQLDRVKNHAQQYIENGVTVRMLDEEKWICSLYGATPKGYIIADEDLVLIQKKQECHIRYGEEDIREYRDNFEHNWCIASDLDAYLENAL